MAGYSEIKNKLEHFIDKYYKNQLLKGLMLCLAYCFTLFFTVVLLEHFGRFNTTARTILFYTSIISVACIIALYIAKPILHLFRLGNRITYEKSVDIIKTHFGEIEDQLLNLLQLNNEGQNGGSKNELLIASIEQKARKLQPYKFSLAIDFKENKKYIKFIALPLITLAGLFFASPSLITNSTQRLVKHNIHFEKPAPFSFIVDQDLTAIKGESFELVASIKGELRPERVYLLTSENAKFLMNKIDNSTYSFKFKSIQNSVEFNIKSGEITSLKYELVVRQKPTIISSRIKVEYPKYTGLDSEVFENINQIVVPEGSKTIWDFTTQATDKIGFVFNDSVTAINRTSENKYQADISAIKSIQFLLVSENNNQIKGDTITNNISIIKDEYPSLKISEFVDTNTTTFRFISGTIADDYGIKNAQFVYQIKHNGKVILTESEWLTTNGNLQQSVNYPFDISKITLEPGQELDYFIVVWDNDEINGSKQSKSAVYKFKAPTKKELKSKVTETSTNVKSSLQESIKEAKELNEKIASLKKDMLEKKNLDWGDKQKIDELLKQQSELEKAINKIKEENLNHKKLEDKVSEKSDEIKKKEELLEKILDELMNDELKDLMDELEKLKDKANKNKLQQNLDKLEDKNESLEEELDRTLEIFKQIEFEQKLEKTIDELEKLKKEQQDLAEKENNSDQDFDESEKSQEALNKDFEELSKELEELKKKNEELEFEHEMPETKSLEEEIKKDMQESSDALNKKSKSGSQKKQKSAEQKMDQLSQQMQDMQANMENEEHTENMETLRQILENLITLSFDQEDILDRTKGLKRKDPLFVGLGQEQRILEDNAQIIKDSLLALSRRVVEIEPEVLREISSIESNIEKTVKQLANRKVGEASNRQQLTMTSINNLALLLDGILQNMQQQMSSKKFGNKSCSKPGSGKPSMSDVKKSQQGLNKKLQEMLDKLGQNPGEKGSKGSKPSGTKSGGEKQSEDIAKLAAEQAAIRQMLRDIQSELKGNGGSQINKQIKHIEDLMELNEEELVNFKFNQESLLRQQEILTKMLESEKAQKEQEEKEERESKTALENENEQDFEILQKYLEKKQQEVELLRTIFPSYNLYYKQRVNEYINYVQ